jgi:hypothetical protein
MEFIKGPLGSHRNYIIHIVLPNCLDYIQLQNSNREIGNQQAASKYDELRSFLNAIESMNNVLDYYYYENEDSLSASSLNKYRKKAMKKYPILFRIAELANAYKHCVREHRGEKNEKSPWAKNLQRPRLDVNIDLASMFNAPQKKEDIKVGADYYFEWPIPEYEKIFDAAFEFWRTYVELDRPDLSSLEHVAPADADLPPGLS